MGDALANTNIKKLLGATKNFCMLRNVVLRVGTHVHNARIRNGYLPVRPEVVASTSVPIRGRETHYAVHGHIGEPGHRNKGIQHKHTTGTKNLKSSRSSHMQRYEHFGANLHYITLKLEDDECNGPVVRSKTALLTLVI